MSLLANIDHLAIAAGIEAVVVDAKSAPSRESRGDQKWRPVLEGALDLFQRTDEKSIRLVVGKHTIVVQKENEETVAVVLPTGHAIAKSLRRMIRRMARKDRGPLPKARLAEVQQQQQQQQQHQQPSTPAATSAAQSTPPSGGQPTVAPTTKPSVAPPAKPAEEPASKKPASASDRSRFPSF